MMKSNLLSRLLPSNPTGRSIYDELRAHDVEDQTGLALDEENLRFRDDELGADHEVFNGEDSRITTESTAFLGGERNRSQGRAGDNKDQGLDASNWLPQSPRLLDEDGDDDVPESLLIEGNGNNMPGPGAPTRPRARSSKNQQRRAIPGPTSRENRAHWEAAQAQQQLHQERNMNGGRRLEQPQARLFTGSDRDKAMWRWSNVTDIDGFMHEVYDYYLGCGFKCIVVKQSLYIV